MPEITPEQHDDITFLSRTMNWVYWPYCPVKRYVNNEVECAACYDAPNGKRIVYFKNLLSAIEEGLKDTKSIEYNSSYDMVMDGWMVD
jgi:hypothetical protein